MRQEKKEKRRLERFLYYDFTGIENHLKHMAAKGWLLKERGSSFWVYEKIPPQDLTFAVSYLPEVSDYDPVPTDGQLLYYELCESAGWTKVAQWSRMQIFCTSNPDPVPLETDPAIRLESIEKSMKRTLLPNLLCFGLILAVQIWSFQGQLERNPAEALSSAITLLMPLLFTLVLCCHITEALPYWIWHRKSRRSVASGGDVLPSSTRLRWLSNVFLALAIICFIPIARGGELTGGSWFRIILIIVLPSLAVAWLAVRVRETLKEQNTPRLKNQAITMGVAVGGTAAAMFVILFVTVAAIISGAVSTENDRVIDTIEIPMADGGVYQWEIYRDEIPLSVEDLVDSSLLTDLPGYEYYSRECRSQETVFVSFHDIRQDDPPHKDYDLPELRYEITATRFDRIFDLCLNHILDEELFTDYETQEWIPVDTAGWSCSQAWRRFYDGAPQNRWLLADRDAGTIAEVTFYWEVTDSQLDRAVEILFAE